MNNSLPQFEAAYTGEPVIEGVTEVPWNIGEPQPPIARLIDAGEVQGKVLDAGCGVGATSLALAARGFDVVGADSSPTAIAQARQSAEERGLPVSFELVDITALSGHDGQFGTVIDSTLLHSLPVDARSAYVAAIARAAAPGAVLHALVFSREAPFPEGKGPNAVDEEELRAAVSTHWTVDEIAPAPITAVLPEHVISGGATGPGRPGSPLGRDEQGRALLPGFLLRAHLPG